MRKVACSALKHGAHSLDQVLSATASCPKQGVLGGYLSQAGEERDIGRLAGARHDLGRKR